MSAKDRLYSIDNKTEKHTINIEDTLYKKLIKFIKKNYDATFSQVVNVCLEDFIKKNKPTYYEKPKGESVTYRSIMFRKNNLKEITKMHKRTGISVTRLINLSVKEFLEKYDI